MADVVTRDAGTASVDDGVVLLDSSDGTALAFTPAAARSTGESLIQAAEDAEFSIVSIGRHAGLMTIVGVALCLSACVNPSAKIATELTRYGLDSRQADCVGNRLEGNLSIGQLHQLAQSARAYSTDDTSPGRLTAGDFIRVAASIEDPRVPIEVGRAAAGCGLIASALGEL